MLPEKEDLSQMAAKLLPWWEGHPGGKHQPAKDLCMSKSSSGQVSQPGGFACLSQQPSKCRSPQESRQGPSSPLGPVKSLDWGCWRWKSGMGTRGALPPPAWNSDRVMSRGGSPALPLLTAPLPLCSGYLLIAIDRAL